MTDAPTDPIRRAFQAIYGSWAGTLIAQGRSDAEIVNLLECSAVGVSCSGHPVSDIADCARATILGRLAELRSAIPTVTPS